MRSVALSSLALGVAAVALATACSGPLSTQSAPAMPAMVSQRAASPPPPIDYIYVANYNSSDIAQLAIDPNAKQIVKLLAPNYKLPASCVHPDSLAPVPRDHLIFVACFSGKILALAVRPDHTVTASKIKPLPAASPLYIIAPHSGAAHVLYASLYPGAIEAFAYTSKSLKLLGKYSTGSIYPNQMAFYTNSAKQSTLFVAEPFASIPCPSAPSTGSIVGYSQNSQGLLKIHEAIPPCGSAYNVVVANDNLYWAGPSLLGGWSLTKNAPLPSPSPLWAASKGPPYYANDMAVVEPQPTHKPAAVEPNGGSGSDVVIGANDDVIEIVGDSFQPEGATPPKGNNPTQAVSCRSSSRGFHFGAAIYQGLCTQAISDTLDVLGVDYKTRRVVHLQYVRVGSMPIASSIEDRCDDYAYYSYYSYC